jgi:DNA-binding LacI/PurR family transcriptional regulator
MKNPPVVLTGGESKYVWFAGQLRRQIEEGELKPGDRFPSRSFIKEQYHVTQPTIERAQAILEREGFIVRGEKLGFIIADRAYTKWKSVNSSSRTRTRISSGTIGILTPNEGQVKLGHRQPGWSDYITQGALDACREYSKHALLLNPSRLRGEELEQLLGQSLLGFVFAAITSSVEFEELQGILKVLQQSQQTVVLFGNTLEFGVCDHVACDHADGCYQLTRWLIERGCRNILPFWPPLERSDLWLEERLQGYRRAVEEAGLEIIPVREFPMKHSTLMADDTIEKFQATVRHKAGYLADYLGSQKKCDAILVASDGEVPTTAAACRLLGYEPNRDVLIAGYDNYWRDTLERCFEPTPPIATVDKHNWEAGRQLVKVLLKRSEGELGDKPHLHYVKPELLPLDNLKS